ncbi:unnamed protein product, partial [Prunus brigantina]
MFVHGAIEPLRPYKVPTREEKSDSRGKEMAAIITFFDDLLKDDALSHPWKNNPKPSETIWEPCENMEKAYWHKYSKSSSYNTPWLLANG